MGRAVVSGPFIAGLFIASLFRHRRSRLYAVTTHYSSQGPGLQEWPQGYLADSPQRNMLPSPFVAMTWDVVHCRLHGGLESCSQLIAGRVVLFGIGYATIIVTIMSHLK